MPLNLRIIAERDPHGNWSAWFDGRPQWAYGGDEAATAVSRLAYSREIDPGTLSADYDACQDGHMEFTLGGQTCPDCGGTGKYIGFLEVGNCETCDGSGKV